MADGGVGAETRIVFFCFSDSLVSSDHTPNNEMTSGGFAKQVGYNF